ncbi:MAG: insulinase family protein [Acidobacteria bacterium]|nr:MAG: insulinase family protein [Acidobacteriota bacterium]REK01528.1 MAG: insulinase family protein [Acidobacteriota bacterium]REK14484.1 MAG: insulinase family protein [Acidobacteriota bacterium]REK45199.1 MAG: insulinase family protein [Acidobacteriota bacterium]
MKKLSIALLLLALNVAAYSQTKVPEMPIFERTLSNGLKVVTVQDRSNPVVTVQVWYRVGGKDDPEGKSGFAHMFEHMMFKATKNMPNETMDRLTEDVGGWNNASTREDLTNYYEEIPSNYLETLLWAEAERMVNLAVDEGNFASERDVVKEEYRQGVLANPYGMFFQYLDSLTFKKHPYKRGVIGNLDELNAASLEDAFAFYREYYRPDNASLIIVGDFDRYQLDKWIDKYFGSIKNPEGEIRRVSVVEPDKTEEERYDRFRPNVPECCPALGITYLAPPSDSDDVPALEILQAILSGGESSRLYQSLIYKKQIAQDVGFFADIRTEKGLLIFYSIAASGKTTLEMEKAIDEEIAKLREEAPSAIEVEKAKNVLITRILRERETVNGKAVALGEAIIYKGDPKAANKEVSRLQSVTPADIKRIVNKYMGGKNRVVINYRNGEEDAEANVAASDEGGSK